MHWKATAGAFLLYEKTHVIVKNASPFYILIPKGCTIKQFSNIGKLENDTIKVFKAGSLLITFRIKDKNYGVLAHINYFGVVQYKNKDAPDEIVIRSDEDLEEELIVPDPENKLFKNWSIIWQNGNKYLPLHEETNSTVKIMSLKKIITKIKENPEIGGSEWTLQVYFNDETSNNLPNGSPGGSTFQFITIKDERVVPPKEYGVKVVTVPNGTITATPTKALAGMEITLSVAPNNGYRLKEGSLRVETIGGNTVALSGNRFIMPSSDVIISAEFEPIPVRKIGISVVGQGSITATPQSGIVGTRIRLSITSSEGYRFVEGSLRVVMQNGTPVAVENNEFIMPDMDVSVSGEFKPIPLYDVLISSALSHGTITATPSKALAGTEIMLSVVPNNGYRLKEGTLKVETSSGKAVALSGNRFTMPSSDVMVSAEFESESSGVSLIKGEKIVETNGKVSLYLSENAEIKLYSLGGTLLLQESATANTEKHIGLPEMQGIYILSVTTSTRNFSWKVKK